jgi:hypothetical protein
VGDLVAGPAGSYICANCVIDSGRLLGADPAPSPEPHEKAEADTDVTLNDLVGDSDEEEGAESAGSAVFVGQADALAVLESALKLGSRRILLVGPEGSGKSAFLRGLAEREQGVLVSNAQVRETLGPSRRLLLDDLDELDANGWQRLVRLCESERDRPMLIALRGELPPPSLQVSDDQAEISLFSTQELVSATGGKLPRALAEGIQVAVGFRQLATGELVEVGRQLLNRRASELFLTDDLLAALVEQAVRSGRGAHELQALLGRIPSGSWNLKSGAAAAKKKRGKKKAEG